MSGNVEFGTFRGGAYEKDSWIVKCINPVLFYGWIYNDTK